MTTKVLEEVVEVEQRENTLLELERVLNKYLQQKLKGRTLFIGNSELGEVIIPSENVEVLYTSSADLETSTISFMKYHNDVTHNFNYLETKVQEIHDRCVKAKIRFFAFKEV